MHQHATADTRPNPPSTRAAGIAIAAATIFSIIFVALDQGASGEGPKAVMQSMIDMRGMKGLVHGVAIASVLSYAFGYASLAARLQLRRPLVLAGLTTYMIGCVAMIGATTLDGFVSTDLAATYVNMAPDRVKIGYDLIVFAGVALTDLAKVGWVLQAAAALAWSVVMLHKKGAGRLVGAIGLLSSALVLAAVFGSGANMGMAAILSILVAQAIWNLAAAVFLFRKPGDAETQGWGAAQVA